MTTKRRLSFTSESMRKVLYPALLSTVMLIALAATFFTVRYLTVTINAALVPAATGTATAPLSPDLNTFDAVTEKLGIDVPERQ